MNQLHKNEIVITKNASKPRILFNHNSDSEFSNKKPFINNEVTS